MYLAFSQVRFFFSHPAGPRIRRRAQGADWCGLVCPALRLGFAAQSPYPLDLIDGVYAADDDDRPQFQVLPAPDDAEIVRLTETLAARIRAFLRQRGLGPDSDPEESDPLSRDEPCLAYLYAASVRGKVVSGANRRATRHADQIDLESMEGFPSMSAARRRY